MKIKQHLVNRKLFQPRGRLLGGSSQLNIMLYVRGNSGDYDNWAENSGFNKFSYENILPFFKKSQNATNYGDEKYNGKDGLLRTCVLNPDNYPYGDLGGDILLI